VAARLAGPAVVLFAAGAGGGGGVAAQLWGRVGSSGLATARVGMINLEMFDAVLLQKAEERTASAGKSYRVLPRAGTQHLPQRLQRRSRLYGSEVPDEGSSLPCF
jgi:hypothetical protein